MHVFHDRQKPTLSIQLSRIGTSIPKPPGSLAQCGLQIYTERSRPLEEIKRKAFTFAFSILRDAKLSQFK